MYTYFVTGNSIAMCEDLKTVHPAGTRTHDLLIWRPSRQDIHGCTHVKTFTVACVLTLTTGAQISQNKYKYKHMFGGNSAE
jgi:hypothetical protein